MEWILALPDGCGDEAGLAGPLRRSVGLDVGRGRARRVPSPRHVNLFTTLRTISSDGAAVKPPPACTGPKSSRWLIWPASGLGTRDDVGDATGQLGAVVGPDTLAPVAVAACLGRQQVEQGRAVPRVVARDATVQDPFVEQRAGLLHR